MVEGTWQTVPSRACDRYLFSRAMPQADRYPTRLPEPSFAEADKMFFVASEVSWTFIEFAYTPPRNVQRASFDAQFLFDQPQALPDEFRFRVARHFFQTRENRAILLREAGVNVCFHLLPS